ncbi:DUF424 family protein [Candidatus Micrarchaeota archaeon]|nr:DUF424 family protein [Candidatus Micrarchaeota archaeon]
MYAKVHERRFLQNDREVVRRITAICDASLLGKIFEEKGMVIDLKKYRSFYEGDKVAAKKAEQLLKEATNANLVGKKSVGLALKVMKGNASSVKTIQGIPHLQIYFV